MEPLERACVVPLDTWKMEQDADSPRVSSDEEYRRGDDDHAYIDPSTHHSRHRVGRGGDVRYVLILEHLDRHCHVLFSSLNKDSESYGDMSAR